MKLATRAAVILSLASLSPAQAGPLRACLRLVFDSIGQRSPSPNPFRSPWLGPYLRSLAPSDLLPPETLERLARSVGKPKLGVRRSKGSFMSAEPDHFLVELSAANRRVLSFKLLESQVEGALEINHLRIEDPSSVRGRLRAGQRGKGLPLQATVHALGRIGEALRRAGVRRLVAPVLESYSVALLYRRMLGMTPRSEGARAAYEMLDHYHRLAPGLVDRKDRFQSLAQLIGTIHDSPVTREQAELWERYLREQALPATMELIQDPQGKSIGVRFLDSGQVRLIDTADPDTPLLQWNHLPQDLMVELGPPALSP
jgi:hypothetical protein